ncbi:biotin/lipoyl-containing protein, partial [Phenylobacterium sp.]|uniref:biotin/lipoyl-containing protein n=1 Tax=Phenylobacterium sp. TaxID=1871053 RepID=UPI002E34B1F4
MPIDVLMPALSPTMEEGALAKWHVKVGDKVAAGDVIAEIETDKATMEVEAVDEGVVEEILVPEGTEEVKVNTPIARLSGEGAGVPPTKAEAAPNAPSTASQFPSPASGRGEKDQTPAGRSSPVAETTGEVGQPKAGGGGARVFASPVARRIAQQKGIDLSAVQGSGPHGRIVRADVEKAQPGAKPAQTPGVAPAARGEPRPVQSLQQMGIPEGSYDLIPLDGMRKTVARRMTDSFRDVPH